MGYSKKHQTDDSESRRWLISGIGMRATFKPLSVKVSLNEQSSDEDACCTTPTARESRISEKLACPPAPRKRRLTTSCKFDGHKEFFNPPDLESVFYNVSFWRTNSGVENPR